MGIFGIYLIVGNAGCISSTLTLDPKPYTRSSDLRDKLEASLKSFSDLRRERFGKTTSPRTGRCED